MCCDWWQKKACDSYEIPEKTYKSLQSILRSEYLQSLTITVLDNRLNASKCYILYELLSKSSVKQFTLHNNAHHFGLDTN